MKKDNFTSNFQVFLVCLALFLQLFFYRYVSFIKKYTYFKLEEYYSFLEIGELSLFAFYFVAIGAIGRVVGAYFTGKYAKNIEKLPKFLVLIALLHLIKSTFLSIFCFANNDPLHIIKGFYLIGFVHALLIPGTIVLPSVYLFKTTPKSKWIKISSYLVICIVSSRLLASQLQYMPKVLIEYFPLIFVGSCTVSWLIYAQLAKKPMNLEPEISTGPCSYRKKILAVVLGAAAATALFYHSFFLEKYLYDILVVTQSNFGIDGSVYLTLVVLFIFPCALLGEKYGIDKIFYIGLVGILVLGFQVGLVSYSSSLYIQLSIIKQILYAFFSGLVLAPVQIILYKNFKNTSNVVNQAFWFSIGYSFCNVIGYMGSKFGFSNNFPNAGRFSFQVVIILCLLAIYKFELFKDDANKNQDLANA